MLFIAAHYIGALRSRRIPLIRAASALKQIGHSCIDVGTSIIKRVCKVYVFARCTWVREWVTVRGLAGWVRSGLMGSDWARWGPIWSDGVISHTARRLFLDMACIFITSHGENGCRPSGLWIKYMLIMMMIMCNDLVCTQKLARGHYLLITSIIAKHENHCLQTRPNFQWRHLTH